MVRLEGARAPGFDAGGVGELHGLGDFSEAEAGGAEPGHAGGLGQAVDFAGVGERGGERFIDEQGLVGGDDRAGLGQVDAAVDAFEQDGIDFAGTARGWWCKKRTFHLVRSSSANWSTREALDSMSGLPPL